MPFNKTTFNGKGTFQRGTATQYTNGKNTYNYSNSNTTNNSNNVDNEILNQILTKLDNIERKLNYILKDVEIWEGKKKISAIDILMETFGNKDQE